MLRGRSILGESGDADSKLEAGRQDLGERKGSWCMMLREVRGTTMIRDKREMSNRHIPLMKNSNR